MIDSKIFRAYDIRGIVGKDFQPAEAKLIGQAYGTYLQKLAGGSIRVAIGHDNRFTSDELTAFFTEGLLSTGCEVLHIGLSLTPIVHFTVLNFGLEGGVNITASHNPKEFNGFRLDKKRGLPIYNEEIQKIRRLVETQKFSQGAGKISYQEVFEDYFRAVIMRVNLSRRLKVVVDAGNGTASKFAPRILEGIGCEVIEQHCNLQGEYPYHTPDPERRVNMRDTQARVIAEKADLGIGFDTDGDRLGIVDEKGSFYETDKILIVLARDILRRYPGSQVLFDVKSSYVLENEIKKAGGVPQMIQTGHPYFKMAMEKDQNILLGGELSGHVFIKDNYYGFDDALFAAARILELLSKAPHPFSEFFKDIPKTAHTEELQAPTPDDKKFEIEENLKKDFRAGGWDLLETDGLRIKFSETAWALVRASNTSPYLSLRFEAENEDKLREIIEIVEARLQKYPVVDTSCLRKDQP